MPLALPRLRPHVQAALPPAPVAKSAVQAAPSDQRGNAAMTLAADAGGQASRRLDARDLAFPAAVFLSAGLVFTLEPLLGKLLLPLLGGSPAVWNTSLAVFQAALLAGYLYAHLLQRIGSIRRQMTLHLVALALGALCLPPRVSGLLGAPWTALPALWLVGVLVLSIGLPFALLSATAPLLQAWSARRAPDGTRRPEVYGLYAASNLGSLIALGAYPSLVEPLLGLHSQAALWRDAYLVFGGLIALTAALSWNERAVPAPAVPVRSAAPATARERLGWILLSAAPSSLLLGVTSHITADVASVPFLWVLPLELYLATLVIAFARPAAPPPPWLLVLQAIATPAALIEINGLASPWPEQLAIHLAAFSISALACHLALAARRPEPGRLTEFYLYVSLGGVAGGAFNAFLAPLLFDRVVEYPLVLIAAALVWPGGGGRMPIRERGWLIAGLFCLTPMLIPGLQLWDLQSGLMAIAGAVALLLRAWPWALVLVWSAIAACGQIASVELGSQHFRSFFGVVQVHHSRSPMLGRVRVMVHGVTLHGVQSLEPAKRCTPTSYYGPPSLIGGVFRTAEAQRPGLRIATIGLGAGTAATLIRASDRLRFFEIDPMVVRLARDPRLFTFLSACARGPTDVVVGDARLSLQHERPGSYDLVLIDAFSSDSIPTHLLTVEALKGYLNLLRPGGVVLLHLSNRNLDLSGPAEAAAQAAGASALYGEHWVYQGVSPYDEAPSIALLVARRPETLNPYRRADPDWRSPHGATRAWTDDYTSVWSAMLSRLRRPGGD
jgi:hypothetical protein